MSPFIQHVSDTSVWVAHYRALESERPDAMFNDPFAKILVGDRAADVQNLKSETTKWTQWTVIMRTYIIDQMIQELIASGVTTIVNLGAGLDSRPYRMDFGRDVTWIEVDFPHVIDYKRDVLEKFQPKCKLESLALDLSNRKARQALFADLAGRDSKIAVLTEGVLPYLTVEQVSELSEDLRAHASFKYWIAEYISEQSYAYLKNPERMKVLKNAPFLFFPPSWMGFFKDRGWRLKDERYYTEVSEKFGRPSPLPKFVKLLLFLMGPKKAAAMKRMSGFLIWER